MNNNNKKPLHSQVINYSKPRPSNTRKSEHEELMEMSKNLGKLDSYYKYFNDKVFANNNQNNNINNNSLQSSSNNNALKYPASHLDSFLSDLHFKDVTHYHHPTLSIPISVSSNPSKMVQVKNKILNTVNTAYSNDPNLLNTATSKINKIHDADEFNNHLVHLANSIDLVSQHPKPVSHFPVLISKFLSKFSFN